MIASLGMYDLPGTHQAWDSLWQKIRTELAQAGIDAPRALDRGTALNRTWRSEHLILGQTCGLPYRIGLANHVALIGAFDFGLSDCPAGTYRSVYIARDGAATLSAFAGQRLALNSFDSQSGWAAIHAEGISFQTYLETGAHAASIQAVANGMADVASIDAVTWRFLDRFQPNLTQSVHIIGQSAASPGLPLITGRGNDTAQWQSAIRAALSAMDSHDAAILGIRGLVPFQPADYLRLPIPPTPTAGRLQSATLPD